MAPYGSRFRQGRWLSKRIKTSKIEELGIKFTTQCSPQGGGGGYLIALRASRHRAWDLGANSHALFRSPVGPSALFVCFGNLIQNQQWHNKTLTKHLPKVDHTLTKHRPNIKHESTINQTKLVQNCSKVGPTLVLKALLEASWGHLGPRRPQEPKRPPKVKIRTPQGPQVGSQN